jgi:hypothetical protein
MLPKWLVHVIPVKEQCQEQGRILANVKAQISGRAASIRVNRTPEAATDVTLKNTRSDWPGGGMQEHIGGKLSSCRQT